LFSDRSAHMLRCSVPDRSMVGGPFGGGAYAHDARVEAHIHSTQGKSKPGYDEFLRRLAQAEARDSLPAGYQKPIERTDQPKARARTHVMVGHEGFHGGFESRPASASAPHLFGDDSVQAHGPRQTTNQEQQSQMREVQKKERAQRERQRSLQQAEQQMLQRMMMSQKVQQAEQQYQLEREQSEALFDRPIVQRRLKREQGFADAQYSSERSHELQHRLEMEADAMSQSDLRLFDRQARARHAAASKSTRMGAATFSFDDGSSAGATPANVPAFKITAKITSAAAAPERMVPTRAAGAPREHLDRALPKMGMLNIASDESTRHYESYESMPPRYYESSPQHLAAGASRQQLDRNLPKVNGMSLIQ